MIKIGKPRIEPNGEQFTRLIADICIEERGERRRGERRRGEEEKRRRGEEEKRRRGEEVWAEVDNRFREYLCHERSDAFVIALLHYAMLHNHDIVCEAPMGEDLYYQITTYLIDAVAKGSPRMHPIRIVADIDSTDLPCAGKVGTGISCGIDSLHVLSCLSHSGLPRHNITHLAFNNVGSHGEGERAARLFAERKKMAERFCRDHGFTLTEVNSNLMDVFKQNHLLTNTYSSVFAVFVLQKLYSVYYYASCHSFLEFSLTDNDLHDTSFYDLLLLSAFSTNQLKLYSEGGTLSRLEKTRKVAEYEPSYRYLNVCVETARNCCRCEKCTRTLLALDALGRLDHYRNVFDIDFYKTHRRDSLTTLLIQKAARNQAYEELYPYFKEHIDIGLRIKALPGVLREMLKARLPQGRFRTWSRHLYHGLRRRLGH